MKPHLAYVYASDTRPERFKNNILEHLTFRPKLVAEHHADEKYPSVSAASILAKVLRDSRFPTDRQKIMEDPPEHCPRNLPVKTLLTGGLIFDGSGKCLLAHLLVRVTLTNHRRLTPKLTVSELSASVNRNSRSTKQGYH